MVISISRSFGFIGGFSFWLNVWIWLSDTIWFLRLQRFLSHGRFSIFVDEICSTIRGVVMLLIFQPKRFRIWIFKGSNRIRWVIKGKDLFWVSLLKTNQGRSDDFDMFWSEIEMGRIAPGDHSESDRWIAIFSSTEKGKSINEIGMSLKIFSLTISNLRFIESEDKNLKEGITIWSLWCLRLGRYWCVPLRHLYITLKRYRFLHIISLVITERVSKQLVSPFLILVLVGVLSLWLLVVIMAQLALNKGKAAMVRTETVKISGSLLAERIQQFSLTLIGRLMNPGIQRMDSLVTNMPKIWKMEDKVVGADLGKGTFQFNFQSEEDLQGVLQNVPYHFDGWMFFRGEFMEWLRKTSVGDCDRNGKNHWLRKTSVGDCEQNGENKMTLCFLFVRKFLLTASDKLTLLRQYGSIHFHTSANYC